MSKKDYTKFTKTNDEHGKVQQTPTNYISEDSNDIGISDEIHEDVMTIEPEVVREEAPKLKKTKIGIVVNCERLNVRRDPRRDALIVCTINKNTEVMIDENGSTRYFYKICTASGIEGFCVRDYIAITE